jgi:hypothetical protein
MRAYQRDSQAGTPLARENPDQQNKLLLNGEQIESINTILRVGTAISLTQR